MLLQIFELPAELAIITAIVIPIIAVCFFIITIPWLKNREGSQVRNYLSFAITPPRLNVQSTVTEADSSIKRNDKAKLYFYYVAIALFLISFIIGEFYEVMFDLALPVNQGSTGEYRTISAVVFQSLFNAGWVGELPWIGFETYHETWSWIFFTAAYTDNPQFLATILEVLLLFSIGVGLVFLAPLCIKSIRHSFVPAMFFFMSGMTIFTKTAIGYTAGALYLLFSTLETEYIQLIVTRDMVPNYSGVLTSCFLLVLPMFALFVVLGRRLWKIYYTDVTSRKWFTVYVTLSFWIGLLLTLVVM